MEIKCLNLVPTHLYSSYVQTNELKYQTIDVTSRFDVQRKI